jgi:hypothetical protein
MKKILALIFLGCLTLASCEKSQIITPTSVGVNKISQSDSLKAVNDDEVKPPIVPVGGDGPK